MKKIAETPLRAWRDPWFLAILVLGAFLIFKGLGDRPLWQDEAETANLAVNVLKTGLPHVFDGVNIVSQEERREFGPDMLWRWSPWMQIYMSAAGLAIAKTTFFARFFFALSGLLCIAGTYLLILRRFGDRAWALVSAALLTAYVPFLLFARQGRYYSAGGLLLLVVLWGFLGDWQKRNGPMLAIALGLGALFHANYLLFISLVPPFLFASLALYPESRNFKRVAVITGITSAMVIPGMILYRFGRQSAMFDIMLVPENLMLYFADWVMFMMPLPVLAGLAWRWRRTLAGGPAPTDPRERFSLFLVLMMIGGFLLLALVPQRFHRYIVHFYPACAIVMAWVGLALWRFFKPAGVLFLLLVGLTNWLHIIPMERLGIVNRPWQNDFRMLTSVNIPLKLHVTEILCGYPDVNRALIEFFNKNAKPGQTLLAEYGDMPLQFYTNLRVIGGLQGPVNPDEKPDWVSLRRDVRVNRDGLLFGARDFVVKNLDLERDYERVPVDTPDETFGNRADPYFHAFLSPGAPQSPLVLYKRKEPGHAR
ncbi:hypothetical protein JCM15519_16220 [Fundidesulfovibrio butyratiphilus]